MTIIMGGDLGGLRDGPPKMFEVGTAHAFVPPIFEEVVLKNGEMKKFFCEIEVFC